MKKIGLLWTNPYSGNRGVGALSYSILYLLEQIAKECNVQFEYYIIGTAGNRRDIDTLQIGGSKIKVQNMRNILPITLKEKVKSIIFYKDFIAAKKLDYILDIGEGDSFSDIYGETRFNFLNYTKKRYNAAKIKQMLLPQTIGPFADPLILKRALSSLNKCQRVLVRDKQSYDFLKKNNITTLIDEIIDVAFFMPYEKDYISHDCINVGINISSLLWNGGYTRNNQFNLNIDYKETVKSIIDYFLSIENIKIHIVPHVVDVNDNIENDYAISYHIMKEFNNERIILSPFFLTPVFAKNYISALDFFVGARMHAAIAAFSAEVPVYPMAYSRKFNGLFYDTLNYKFMGDMICQTQTEILDGIKQAFGNRANLKEIIKERMSTIVAERGIALKRNIVDFLDLG